MDKASLIMGEVQKYWLSQLFREAYPSKLDAAKAYLKQAAERHPEWTVRRISDGAS